MNQQRYKMRDSGKELLAQHEAQMKDLRSSLADHVHTLEHHADLRLAVLADSIEFLRRRADIESEYARSLDRLAERFAARLRPGSRDTLLREGCGLPTPLTCWQLMLEQAQRESADHVQLAALYNSAVVPRLSYSYEDSTRLLRKSKEIIQKVQDELFKTLQELNGSMRDYHAFHSESVLAEAKLQEVLKREEKQGESGAKRNEKNREKWQEKFIQSKFATARQRNDYLLALGSAETALKQYYTSDLHRLLDLNEVGFYEGLNGALRCYLSAEFCLTDSRARALDAVELAVNGLVSRSDRKEFLAATGLDKAVPPKLMFLAHAGDEVSQITAQDRLHQDLESRFNCVRAKLGKDKLECEEVKKTMDATLKSLKEFLINEEDYDMARLFRVGDQTPRGTDPDGGDVGEGGGRTPQAPTSPSPLPLIARRKQQIDMENFYVDKLQSFMAMNGIITKLEAKHGLMSRALGKGKENENSGSRPPSIPPKPQKIRRQRPPSRVTVKLFNGDLETYIKESNKPVPMVVESCVRYINLHGLHHEGIFRISGSLTQMTEIKSAFERGEDPLDDDDDGRTIDSVAGVLKAYFRGLEKPLFPSHMYQEFLDCIKISEHHKRIAHLRDLIRKLPCPVIVVLRYLFTFLNHLSGFRDENMMDSYNLAVCFGPTLAPVPPEFDQVMCQGGSIELVKLILVEAHSLFPSPRELPGPIYRPVLAPDNEDDDEMCDSSSAEGLRSDDGTSQDEISVDDDPCPCVAVACFDYAARSERELGFRAGDKLELLRRTSVEWWEARLGDRIGAVPHDYLQLPGHVEPWDDNKHSASSSPDWNKSSPETRKGKSGFGNAEVQPESRSPGGGIRSVTSGQPAVVNPDAKDKRDFRPHAGSSASNVASHRQRWMTPRPAQVLPPALAVPDVVQDTLPLSPTAAEGAAHSPATVSPGLTTFRPPLPSAVNRAGRHGQQKK